MKQIDFLRLNGYLDLPTISEAKCDNILNVLKTMTFQQWSGKHKLIGFDYAGAESNIYETKDQTQVYAIPEIQEISNDPFIQNMVRQYLGAKPIQTQADCWWSINHNKAEGGQQFHQDATYHNFLKMYLYLCDVNMENGPHTYVPGSKDNMITPEGDYKPNTRVSDEFIEQNYDEVHHFIGKKGTMMFVDTRGYHKALLIIQGYRILIQFEFAEDPTDLVTGKRLIYI